MSDTVITRQLTRAFEGREVVKEVNLRVEQGSIYGLIGRNDEKKWRKRLRPENAHRLEAAKGNLRPFHLASGIIALCLLGMLYLLAAIPHFDPADAEEALFVTYEGLGVMNGVLAMAAFAILAAVLGSRMVVEEYRGRRAVLLLSWPVPGRRLMGVKLLAVSGYAAGAMLLCGCGVLGIFFLTEGMFPLCADRLDGEAVLKAVFFLAVCTVMAADLGLVSIWIGFVKKSVPAAVVASVLLVSAACQLASAAMMIPATLPAGAALTTAAAAPAVLDLLRRAEEMEG